MPVFITLTDTDVTDPTFWAALDVSADSTIDASGISEDFQITMTASSIAFTDTSLGTTTTYTDSDLSSGSFSAFVEFIGNDGDSDVSGAVGLNSSGYTGGEGDDTFTDDGSLGGGLTGGEGDDTLTGGTGNNNISGGDGDDVLRGGSGTNNILTGGDGDDTLYAEDGGGNLEGGDGDDAIFAGLNTNFVQGGDGTNSLVVPDGSTVTPFFPGSTGGNVTLSTGDSFVYLDIDSVTVACFTQGTSIRTPNGDVPVEALAVGDLVETLDHGPQKIRWIGERTVAGKGKLAPICFRPDSIGNTREIKVSPQHRVLLSGWKCELLFHDPEVLCAAKELCNGDQIYTAPCEEITYFHVMFDRHEIIFAEGALLESFYVGDYIIEADRACYQELVELFPEISTGNHKAQQAARPFIKSYEAYLCL